MADIVAPEVRKRMMAGIRAKNTKPELTIRSGLHRRGFRFKLHDRTLPGKPDLVFPRYGAVIFVNGCFWHGHDCRLFRMPKTRTEFWTKKIESNRARDARVRDQLDHLGFRHFTVWECTLKNRNSTQLEGVLDQCAVFLRQGDD